jgi:DNA-binding transcriptional ArsR family regulator
MNKQYMKTIPAPWRAIARAFTAMGDEHRQRILLLFEPGEELNVGQIADASTLARSTVSFHLRILRESGVLKSRKAGKEVFYSIDKKFLAEALANVLDYLETRL